MDDVELGNGEEHIFYLQARLQYCDIAVICGYYTRCILSIDIKQFTE